MKCIFKIIEWNKTSRIVTIYKCKKDGYVRKCEEENCNYLKKLKEEK